MVVAARDGAAAHVEGGLIVHLDGPAKAGAALDKVRVRQNDLVPRLDGATIIRIAPPKDDAPERQSAIV